MRPATPARPEVDLRPAVSRLAKAHPGRVLIGRFPDHLRLSMLPAWLQDERHLGDDESRMVREPNVIVSTEWEEGSGGTCSIHVIADRLRGPVGNDARELVFRFSKRLNAVMDGIGLTPLATDSFMDLYRVRSMSPEDDVLAIAAAILGKIKPLVGYDPERKYVFASLPRGAERPELSPNRRKAILRAFEKRERQGR